MRISDWSSDVCSSDLSAAATNSTPSKPVASWTACCSRGADRRAETSGGRPRADALHGRWARLLYHDILIGDDLQPAETGAQQLAFFEQECRIARLTAAHVAAGEGFVDQPAAGCQRRRPQGQPRPSQIVRPPDTPQ